MITFGIVLSYAVSYVFSSVLKFVPFMLPIGFSLIQIVLMYTLYNRESPTFLWMNQQKDLAVDLINSLYFENEMDSGAIREVFEEIDFSRSQIKNDFKSLFRDPRSSKALRMGCIVSVLQQLVGINMIIFYSTILFKGSYKPEVATIITGGVNCLSSVLLIFILDSKIYLEMGNRKMLQIGAFGMFLCYAGLIPIQVIDDISNYVQVPLVWLFLVFFEVSIGPIMWIYCADILSEKGVAITSSLNWLTTSLVTLVSGFFLSENRIQNLVLFSIFCFFCLVLLWFSRYKLAEKSEMETEDAFIKKSEISRE